MIPAIYSWQPILTPHQAHTLHALSEASGVPVRPVISKREDEIRRAQGWPSTDDSLIRPELLPKSGWRKRIAEILDDDPQALHLFGSPFERSRVNFALYGAIQRRRRVMLISEPYSPKAMPYLGSKTQWIDRIRAKSRPALYSMYGRLLQRRIEGVFAISPLAVKQFAGLGFRVFPFGYFVPGDELTPTKQKGKTLEVAYLGSFIERKGVPTLLDAFRSAAVVAMGAKLTLFGPDNDNLPHVDAPNVKYGGPLPFGDVQSTLAKFDLLVVPSLYDGWGVVVNEAIQAGIGVLASDNVGAGAMLRRWHCGARFEAGNSAHLARLICAAAADRDCLDEWRKEAAALRPILEPRFAGDYMNACLKSIFNGAAPPEAPWY